jgi:hypothetical protein
MAHITKEDWPESWLVAAPGVPQSHGLLRNAWIAAQFRIVAGLRAMYADLLAESVPAHLLQLVREVEIRETLRHDA